jgi:ketosteroid isomerase-like protein
MRSRDDVTNANSGRREFLLLGGVAALAGAAWPADAEAAWTAKEWSAVEKAHVKTVSDLFHAWENRDGATVERLFAPDAQVRFTRVEGATAPWNGAKAIRAVAERPSKANVKFTILDTVAEGPIVVHRRADRFTDLSGAHCASHGLKAMGVCDDQYIAVFVFKDGKIQEWLELEVAQSTPIKSV